MTRASIDLREATRRAMLEAGTASHYEDAAYYDHTYARRRADARWYALFCAAHGATALELGCGTGRITAEIARAGVEITGVDRMAPMLARAEQRFAKLPQATRARVRLRQGDLRRLSLRRRFDVVIAPFNVFMHLYSAQEMHDALATVRRHLAPGGHFAFDVLLPDLAVLARDPERAYRGRPIRHPNGARYTYTERFDYDAISQVLTISIEMTNVDDPSDQRVQILTQRQHFPQELELLLARSGFVPLVRYGGFDGEPLDGFAESQLLVCRLDGPRGS